jgi:hypothetical protein
MKLPGSGFGATPEKGEVTMVTWSVGISLIWAIIMT